MYKSLASGGRERSDVRSGTWEATAAMAAVRDPAEPSGRAPRSGEEHNGGTRALAGHVRYLTLGGLWPRARGTPYLVYAALVQLCGAAYVAVCLLSVYSARGDVAGISHTLMHTLEISSGVLKAGLFFRKRRAFYRLVRDLELMESRDWGCPELEAARRWARWMTVSLSAYIYALILLWLPSPLLAGGDEWLLPLVQLHGVDWSRRPAAYAALYALQCAVPLTQVPVVIGLDCFFVAAMLHVGALLQLLGQRVSSLRVSSDSYSEDSASDEERHILYAELCSCIQSHQKITKFLQDLEEAMSGMVLVQLSSTMVNLCTALYQQTKIKDVSSALQYAMLLPFHTAQIYFYCWTADNITQQLFV
ncbi:uncharacterized protein LOC124552314 [Schistocerca americana]|uniref:uncharacterized protein LOC124552314 n=1 Tax=Schistocerca americana TaxID=7009 RepID=UPI001F4F3470|nr:uncharacterized protein LOC124552314 [Schistocerca americana]